MIEVMLSSTVADLGPDRRAVAQAFEPLGIAELVGVEPGRSPSMGSSPHLATIDMAQNCHLYVLILGGRYGFQTAGGKSATEVEFDAAYRDDPTKILVFRKRVNEVEEARRAFIEKVSDYHRGYFISEYSEPDELSVIANAGFREWIADRAGVGAKLHFFDHFVRLAVQRTAFPGVRATYCAHDDFIELKYRIGEKMRVVHMDREQIFQDFWGSFSQLEHRFAAWRNE